MLFSYFDIPDCGDYHNAFDRYSSVLHCRLRLDCNALNYYLFKIHCALSPACFCGAKYETIVHNFLYCPRYAAQRISLLLVTAQVFDNWYNLSDLRNVEILLHGSSNLTNELNRLTFLHAQEYILKTKRFSNVI